MATTWESQQPPQLQQTQEQATTASTQPTVSVPEVKIEASPAESFISAPGDIYPSLFSTPSTMNPLESVMTPESYTGDDKAASQASLSPSPSGPATESTEKKPAKKRKSWGQVLPEPKTNLPPRKRAKTEDEKEQRRVERVLRNRRAAQSSRERKRQEVEALERRNSQLEAALLNQQKQNMMLMEELTKLRRDSGVVSRSSSPLDGFQPSPLTLSQPLFGSTESASHGNPGMMNDFILMPEQDGTVDPTSLSPELNPVSDKDVNESSTTTTTTETPAKASSAASTSTDVTQHPAVSVGGGSAVVAGLATTVASSTVTLPAASNAADGLFGTDFSLSSAFDADNWGAQDQFSPSTDPLNFEYNHMVGDAAPEFPGFDFDQFLSDDVSGAAPGTAAGSDSVAQEPESAFSLFDSENQIPSEAFNQQPHTGASTYGCDDGVIAVGV
ncbi:hypothetical protein F5X96DRAFT_644879 [Biscogniauxia mediterranea]|nr:hypothetical protein F5X96DRAFT_644879 [Biscogniauxia mediterranea]